MDGFNAKFYTKTWPIIKHDIYAAVLDFFDTSHLSTQVNIASLTLIPKVSNPTYASDFRPIACCTVVYKIIAKLITHRMQNVIVEVVDTTLAGFIPKRHITNNILLATDPTKGYNRKGISPRCTIKVILKKLMIQLNEPFWKA